MTEQRPERTLHLEKTLAAAPERVFAARVESEKLAAWWPAGFTSPSLQLDVREGGATTSRCSRRAETAGEGTRLVLDQGPFKTDAPYELHHAGWTETLERIERAVA